MRLALDSGRLLDGMSDHVARGMTVQRQNPAYRHTVMHLLRFSQTHGLALFSFIFISAYQANSSIAMARQIIFLCDYCYDGYGIFGYLQAGY